jgi:hypothetical protein
VETSELPALVYQVLLLAKKGEKSLVLARLMASLAELDQSTDEE